MWPNGYSKSTTMLNIPRVLYVNVEVMIMEDQQDIEYILSKIIEQYTSRG